MATYWGTDSYLVFRCKHCCETDKVVSEIMIDPANKSDSKKLGKWLMTHSFDGGTYETVSKEDFKPNKKRIRKEMVINYYSISDVRKVFKGTREEWLLSLYKDMEKRHKRHNRYRKNKKK